MAQYLGGGGVCLFLVVEVELSSLLCVPEWELLLGGAGGGDAGGDAGGDVAFSLGGAGAGRKAEVLRHRRHVTVRSIPTTHRII